MSKKWCTYNHTQKLTHADNHDFTHETVILNANANQLLYYSDRL